MLRQITAQVLIAALLLPGSLFAIECSNPFPNSNQFQLVEKLNCQGTTSPVVLQITKPKVAPKSSDPYLSPGCDNKSPYFNLYSGKDILDFSNSLENAHATSVAVTQACDGAPLFRVDREAKLFTSPSGKKVNTSLRVFAQDPSSTLIAYAQADEDTVNSLTLRGPDDEILISASKTLHSAKGGLSDCEAIWTVNGSGDNQLSATVISYLLTLKDNLEFTCDKAPTSAPAGLSGAGGVILGVSIGAVIVLSAVTATACYCARNNPRYAKLIH